MPGSPGEKRPAMNYPLLDVFLTMLWFFLWILWIFLLFRVFGDLFRDDEVGGWGKAGWSVFVILLPFLGVFVYLVVRGHGMAEREVHSRIQAEQEFRAYVRDVASDGGSSGPAGELGKLADLRKHGDITADEYQRAKASLLG
jgi:hypothetical protein